MRIRPLLAAARKLAKGGKSLLAERELASDCEAITPKLLDDELAQLLDVANQEFVHARRAMERELIARN